MHQIGKQTGRRDRCAKLPDAHITLRIGAQRHKEYNEALVEGIQQYQPKVVRSISHA